MKKLLHRKNIFLIFSIVVISISLTNCLKTNDPIKYPIGTFPDSIFNLEDINSEFDDYNVSLYQLTGYMPIVFSSNRKSSGGQFDLEQAGISFRFDQTNGEFTLESEMLNNNFLNNLIQATTTAGDDFGPYRLFSSLDGFEYMITTSFNDTNNLDLFYIKTLPLYDPESMPSIVGPYPVNLINSAYNEAYLCFDGNLDTAYFISDREGDFDIFQLSKPLLLEISYWFSGDFTNPVKVDSINSEYNDKCPIVVGNIMVFTSDRPGGSGGFDLYYSIFKNGKWGTPVNLGPRINSSSDEYRPVIGYNDYFDNYFMIFSSNRPGGKGGFDLYFTGLTIPK